MRKLILLAGAALLLVVSPAAAKTVTVAITKTGYVPKTTTVAVGDSVSFVNQDTASHQVVLKPTTGVTCTPNPLVLAPGQTGTCTFRTAGSYSFTDSTNKGAAFKGTVTVTAAAGGGGGVTIAASPSAVTYGGKTTLSGQLTSGQANQKVSILARACGENSFRQVATATTAANGAYSYVAQPTMNTTYMAKEKSATSSSAPSVVVRPQLVLRRLAARRFSVRLTAADSFVGKLVVFQRYNATRRTWLRVRSVALARTVPAVAPTVVSVVSFKVRIRTGLRVRLVLTAAQASPCYVGTRSAAVRS
jgi:plastocyanin